jgi:hypothetical protein
MPLSKDFTDAVTDHIAGLEKEAGVGGGGQQPPVNAGHTEYPLPPDTDKPIEIHDPRTKLASGVAIEPGQASGHYDKGKITNIIKAAKKVGVDPNLALSVALQETKIGKTNPTSIGNIRSLYYGKAPEGLDQQAYELAKTLKDKMDEGKKLGFTDQALLIQMYNGLGKLGPTMRVMNNSGKMVGVPEKYYGVEVTDKNPLDLRKNPLYGKTILDISENVIKKNKDIQELISKTM